MSVALWFTQSTDVLGYYLMLDKMCYNDKEKLEILLTSESHNYD